MPKGYGYDKAPKKPSGFKMKGFSYAGESPIKGKRKVAEQQAAATKHADAMVGIKEFGTIEGGSTNLMEGTGTVYGQMPAAPSPVKQDIKIDFDPELKLFQDVMGSSPKTGVTTNGGGGGKGKGEGEPGWLKKFTGSKIGSSIGQSIATAAVTCMIGSLMRPKEKKEKRIVNAAEGFSKIKFGRS